MDEFRNRARANRPAVLLTLLSIVQALALKFLWSYIRESPELLIASWTSALMWVQLIATLIGLILIWVVYASHVMRLRWVLTRRTLSTRSQSDFLEFVLTELPGPDPLDQWALWKPGTDPYQGLRSSACNDRHDGGCRCIPGRQQ
jgi:hypothetical protein